MPDNKEIKRLQRIVKREVKATDAQIQTFAQSLNNIIERLLAELSNDISFEQEDFQAALAQLNRIDQILEAQGYKTAFAEIRTLYAEELERVLDTFEDLEGDASLTILTDPRTIEAFIEPGLEKVTRITDELIGDSRQILIDNVLTGTQPDLKEIRETFGRRAANNIQTELTTQLQAFNRRATVTAAVEAFGDNPEFLYIGPNDGSTRPFCRSVLTQRAVPIYSLKEISGLKNGQGLDVMTFGGGYNCRHRWAPVDEDLKRRLTGGG